MIVIETQRLLLREMTPADRPALCRILQDSEVMYAYNGPFSDEEVDEWLERQLARYRQWGYGLWAVVLKATGEMIGQCGLTLQQWNGREMLEAGYLFQRSHWHQGYATEAARACMDYAFGTLNSHLVCSIIRDNNLPSQQVALRNGMTRQAGVMVKHYRGAEMPHWLFIKPRTIRTVRYQSPCGEMLLGATGDRLCLCNWTQELHPGRVEQRLRTILKAQFEDCGQITETETTASQSRQSNPAVIQGQSRPEATQLQSDGDVIPEQCLLPFMPEVLRRTVRELDEYFRGERREFDIPLLLAGSDFQKRVWQQLPSIPYGQTASYGELAAAIGSPRSVRAVANANGANAISIILPCHRIIGSDGSLTGYGGGLRAKQYLLDLECTECTRIGQTRQPSISQINNPQN